jgi:CubicO group peptidase (beta-lactamase class C family)
MYATARDWAKFGLLYLRNGRWGAHRILPEGWVHYTTTPTPQAQDHAYGAHFWLKIPKEFATGGDANQLPKDCFHAVGYDGQFVTIIPSRGLVIVRLGLSRTPSAWKHDTFVAKVPEAVKN